MKNYHKINGVYRRYTFGDRKGQFIMGDYSQPEFDYLKNNIWIGTEKIDGTNIKIHWDGEKQTIHGKTEKSKIPSFLHDKLRTLIPEDLLIATFGNEPGTDVTLYGEGYGNKIQKVGKQYIPDGVSFILFDVLIESSDGRYYFLDRDNVLRIAEDLNIETVPVVFVGTIDEGIEKVKKGFKSSIGSADAEGIVIVPECNLLTRAGGRIITKLKTVDFRER